MTAYVLEWQRVAAEPGHCSACWQMERDGAATTALIQGKGGCQGALISCARELAHILTKPEPPAHSPPSSSLWIHPRVGGLVPWCWGVSAVPPLLSVADGIEPFQRYNISLYPLYEGTVGVPVHTTAYSQQKGTWEGSPRTRTVPF